jgi:hypothetical protein
MYNDFEHLISEASASTRNNAIAGHLYTQLLNAIDDAKTWHIDDDLIQEATNALTRLEVAQDLVKATTETQKHCPLRSQIEYVNHVTQLEKMIEKADAAGVERTVLQSARDLVVRCQIEYWLSTSLARLADVQQATEAHDHDITRLRGVITKAEALQASNSLIQEARLRLLRLETELEMSRALATYQKERLPVENPPPDYWQPGDIGHVVETPGFPLLPEGSDTYLWEPSAAYTRVKTCIDRLKKCLVGIENSKANESLVAEVKDKLIKSEKDFKQLELKDADDKAKAVDIATKAAKKLKKGKKGKK